jgi:hypothetical protein
LKNFFKDWKVHLLCLALTVAAELIGVHKFQFGSMISFSLFPMLYALIFGIILACLKVIPKSMMETASPYIGICVMFLTAKMAADIGPNLSAIVSAGLPLLLQELGNLGTIFFSLPIAVFVFKMGRAAVGCCFSISREGSLAIIGDMYGLDSEEGQGVMGGYITGTLLGTLFNGLIAALFCGLGIFHPYALAMAAGTGSASMMASALAPVVNTYPEMAEELSGFAAASQVLTTADGLYMGLFVALPLTNWLYKKLKEKRKIPKPKEKM